MTALSVIDRVDVTGLPDGTVKVSGLNDRTGASVSGTIVTVRVAEDEFPAASLAVAVHSLVVDDATIGALNVPAENVPPLVQLIVGPSVIRTLSVADKLDEAVPPPKTDKVAGLNDSEGDVVSATGGGGVTDPLDEEEPPPQATPPSAMSANALTCTVF